VKRLGPELKTPDLKVPPFLVDLYWDLRDRRLLPLLALIVVATAAVPFLLGGKSKKTEPPAGAIVAVAGPTSAEDASKLAVVEAKPGLRDYHKRLRGRTAHDPFKQKFTAPDLSGTKLGGGQSEGSSGPTYTTTPETAPSSPSSGGAPPSTTPPIPTGQPSTVHHLTFYTWAITVKITKSGEKGSKPESTIKHKVLPMTKLPGDKAPVVTYMGQNKGHPLLLVSDKAASVFGEAHCLSGEEVCQLLEVEPGFPVSIAYGPNEAHYTINVLKLEVVVVARKTVKGRRFAKLQLVKQGR
jgi:hypothetical protein